MIPAVVRSNTRIPLLLCCSNCVWGGMRWGIRVQYWFCDSASFLVVEKEGAAFLYWEMHEYYCFYAHVCVCVLKSLTRCAIAGSVIVAFPCHSQLTKSIHVYYRFLPLFIHFEFKGCWVVVFNFIEILKVHTVSKLIRRPV